MPAMLSPPVSSITSPERSLGHCDAIVGNKESKRRTRPNLSRVCQKTKMCSFFFRGACSRDTTCTFAHDPSELQAKPDLRNTKLCPALLKSGQCSQVGCKFAHREEELQRMNIEENNEAEASSPLQTYCPLPTMPVPRNKLVSQLSAATLSGPLTLNEMVIHLTSIFSAVFDTRPEVANRVGLPPNVLALATAEDVWADASLSHDSRMSFVEFASRCKLPLVATMPLTLETLLIRQKIDTREGRSTPSIADSDAISQCSTEEGSVSIFSLTRSTNGCQTPTGSDDSPSHGWWERDMPVLNTFIHFATHDVCMSRRRARSVPVGTR